MLLIQNAFSPPHRHQRPRLCLLVCLCVLAAIYSFACASDSHCQHFCLYIQLELKSATSVCVCVCVLVWTFHHSRFPLELSRFSILSVVWSEPALTFRILWRIRAVLYPPQLPISLSLPLFFFFFLCVSSTSSLKGLCGQISPPPHSPMLTTN